MKLDTIENIIGTLQVFLETVCNEKDINVKQKLMWDLAGTVLNIQPNIISEEVDNIMRELGIDLNFIDSVDAESVNNSFKKEMEDTISKLRNIK